MSFEGKVAYVAGAGGMGLRIAQDLIQAGAHVALADVKPAPGELPSGPEGNEYFEGDLTDDGFVEKTMAGGGGRRGSARTVPSITPSTPPACCCLGATDHVSRWISMLGIG